jgi:hypothetical protein
MSFLRVLSYASMLGRRMLVRLRDQLFLLVSSRRAAVDAANGYRRLPQEPDPWAVVAAREAIAQEPW